MPLPAYERGEHVGFISRDQHLEYGIRTRAYQLWEAAGRPEGNDAMGRPLAEHFWLKAEAEIAKPVEQSARNVARHAKVSLST